MQWIDIKTPVEGMIVIGAIGGSGRTYVITLDTHDPLPLWRPSYKNKGEQERPFEKKSHYFKVCSTVEEAKSVCEKHNDELSLLRPQDKHH